MISVSIRTASRFPLSPVDSIMGDSCYTSVCLVMDVSGSMCTYPSYYWDDAKDAAHEFIDNMDPFDRVAIITFSTCVDTLIDFTSDTAALHDAIDNMVCGGWTAAFDGIWTGVDLASTEFGSKAVIAFTDGMEKSQSVMLASARWYRCRLYVFR